MNHFGALDARFDKLKRCAWSARGYGFPQNPSSFGWNAQNYMKHVFLKFQNVDNILDFNQETLTYTFPPNEDGHTTLDGAVDGPALKARGLIRTPISPYLTPSAARM